MANNNDWQTVLDSDIVKTANQIKTLKTAFSELSASADQNKKAIGELSSGFSQLNTKISDSGQLSKSFGNKLKDGIKKFSDWGLAIGSVSDIVSKVKSAMSELKEVNTYLTEISKANASLSKSELSKLGDDSFNIASKYGKSATDYLAGIKEASGAGYKNAKGIAELSLAVQSACDITSELANQYINTADKAYQMNGSVEALTAALDGANSITSFNSVSMTELAEGMSAVSSQAASSQMKIDETTAAVGTLIAVTQKGGSEMGNAFKGILMNLQQVTGEAGDGGNAIDEESLKKYEKACNALGVSLTTVKNGIVSLREPMDILKELSEEYIKLDESDSKRTDLLNAVGGEDRANALNAILENYSLYEKMLQDYASGTGSIAKKAEETANSWEGSLNRLSNTWTDTVGNIADSDAMITAINSLNGLLSVVNTVTDAIGSIGTIGLSAGAILGTKKLGYAYI